MIDMMSASISVRRDVRCEKARCFSVNMRYMAVVYMHAWQSFCPPCCVLFRAFCFLDGEDRASCGGNFRRASMHGAGSETHYAMGGSVHAFCVGRRNVSIGHMFSVVATRHVLFALLQRLLCVRFAGP